MLNDEDIIKLKSVLVTKEDLKSLQTDIASFKEETNTSILEIKSDILSMKGDIGSLKNDVVEIKSDILSMKGDIGSLKNDVVEIKSDMVDLKELIQGLVISNDSIAKSIGNLSVEYAAITSQLSRHELWIKQIAEKVGLNLAID